jgi:hypothetical protein
LATLWPILVLLVAGTIPRLALWLLLDPIRCPDTPSYFTLARQILALDFASHDGVRTPGYPLFLILGGLNEHAVVALQLLMGIAVSVMLYVLTLRDTGSRRLSLLVGVSHSAWVNVLTFEMSLLAEALTGFLVVLSLLVLQRSGHGPLRMPEWVLVSCLVGLAGLVRPLSLALLPVPLALALLDRRTSTAKRLGSAGAYLGAATLIVGGWCGVNWATLGYFGPSVLGGRDLYYHVGAFMEDAPEEYAAIRDAYLGHRPAVVARTGEQGDTIVFALSDISRATGLSGLPLERRLKELAVLLIRQEPLRYARSVIFAWLRFWRPRAVLVLEGMPSQGFAQALTFVWAKQQSYLETLSLLFVLVVAGSCWRALARRRALLRPAALTGAAMVLTVALTQALVFYGENGRMIVPFQPVVVYVALTGAWRWLREPESA